MPRHLTDKDVKSLDVGKVGGLDASSFEKVANRGQPGGYAALDADGKLSIPAALKAALNLQILADDPVSPADGDIWLRDVGLGVFELRVRVAGATKRVPLLV